MSSSSTSSVDSTLSGLRVAFVGRLAGMPRREADQIVREKGGRIADRIDACDWLVVGDEVADVRRQLADRKDVSDELRGAIDAGRVKVFRESEFWAQVGLVDADLGVARLYTPAMLAALIEAPIAAVRQWHRQGALAAAREVGRLPYFDFRAVCAARKLAALWRSGCSLTSIYRRLEEFHRAAVGNAPDLSDPDVIVEGRRLFVRRGDNLAEPSGQLLIDFDGPRSEPPAGQRGAGPVAVPFPVAAALRRGAPSAGSSPPIKSDELRDLAVEFEDAGRCDQAIEVYRALLMSGDSTADDHFALAELLYRSGDLPAARERYYVAFELDEEFVEARSNLGCVLAELGERELAEAAFRGALECHPDYADAHYHLARLLDQQGQSRDEAAHHWREFIALAPASPWAEEAQDRAQALRTE